MMYGSASLAVLAVILAGASAFAPSSFVGKAVASRPVASRRHELRASLEDLEARIAQREAEAAAKNKKAAPAPAAPAAKGSLFKAQPPKPAAPALKPAAKPAPVAAPKAAAPAPKAAAPAAPVVKPTPPAPVAPKAVAPPAATSGASGTDVAAGVGLGVLPWLAAPVVALGAVRPLLAKGTAAREAVQKAAEAEAAAKAKALAESKLDKAGLTEADKKTLTAVLAVAAISLGGILVLPAISTKSESSAPAVVAPKVAPKPAAAPVAPKPAPVAAPKPVEKPVEKIVEAVKPVEKAVEKVVEAVKPAPAPAPAPVAPTVDTGAPAGKGRVLEAETVDPAFLQSLKKAKAAKQ
eukprot:TRINITY_DN5479_c0_g1_i2.p1 TRINITY_DN5479_c0_g1~~TRINITY_DN5479_c0_g1_i2.p1  ORF type:complete len:351 (+),score=116.24 TRINITY_DN5479_c0_g1_i2:37-1089(+)